MTGYVVLEYGKTTPLEALKLFGWWPIGLSEIACSFLLTAVLFLGPLFERGIAEGDWRDWIRGRRIAETLGGWIGWRNFVAVSPSMATSHMALHANSSLPGSRH